MTVPSMTSTRPAGSGFLSMKICLNGNGHVNITYCDNSENAVCACVCLTFKISALPLPLIGNMQALECLISVYVIVTRDGGGFGESAIGAISTSSV